MKVAWATRGMNVIKQKSRAIDLLLKVFMLYVPYVISSKLVCGHCDCAYIAPKRLASAKV